MDVQQVQVHLPQIDGGVPGVRDGARHARGGGSMIDENGLLEFISELEDEVLFATVDFDEGWREALYRVKAWVESHAVEGCP